MHSLHIFIKSCTFFNIGTTTGLGFATHVTSEASGFVLFPLSVCRRVSLIEQGRRWQAQYELAQPITKPLLAITGWGLWKQVAKDVSCLDINLRRHPNAFWGIPRQSVDTEDNQQQAQNLYQ